MKTLTVISAVACSVLSLASVAGAADPATSRLWRAKCSSCHGDDGKAQTDEGKRMSIADLSTAAWQKQFTDAKITSAIEAGVDEVRGGVKKEMKPYKAALRPDQIVALVVYVRGLAK